MWRLALALGFLLMGVSACGPKADAKTVVEVFLSSRDTHDVDGALSVLAPDAALRAPNELQYTGAQQIRQWLQGELNNYSFQISAQPKMEDGRVTWHDNLYNFAGDRWIGEIAWTAEVADMKISALQGRVVRGASGVICQTCPPTTSI